MEVDWPNKPTRETWEIEQFMDCYRRFPSGRDFEIVSKGDRPDYTVRDKCTGEMFGVELTSVYIDNRSVPDDHKVEHEEDVEITYDRGQLELYLSRLVEAVSTKVTKARSKYDTSNPLILSVYVNEYISIYIRRRHLEQMVRENSEVFDHISPFLEVIFWDLPNNDAMSVRPG